MYESQNLVPLLLYLIEYFIPTRKKRNSTQHGTQRGEKVTHSS